MIKINKYKLKRPIDMKPESIRSLLKLNGYYTISIALIDRIGWTAAIVLADLLWKHEYFEERNMLDEEGGFFNTEEDRCKSTRLSIRKQMRGIKKLSLLEIIETKLKGLPARNYFYIDYQKIQDIIDTPLDDLLVLTKRKNYTKQNVTTTNNKMLEHNYNRGNKDKDNKSFDTRYQKKGKAPSSSNKFSRQSKKLSNRTKLLVKPKLVQSPIVKQKQMLERDILYYEQKDEHIRKLFLYWNTLDITNHKDIVTKTKLNSYKQLDKQLDKYTPDEISDSFDCYAKLVEKYPNKFCKAPYKCSLPEFFKWSAQQRSMIRNKKDLNSIKSIFYVCKMGYSYTLKYFENKKTIVNCNRKILSAVQKYGLELLDDRRIKQNADILAKVCVRLEKFYKSYQNKLTGLNGNGARGLASLLWNYVDEENDLDNFKLWWLNSDNMFNGFEQWLEDNGYLNNTSSCYRDAEYDEHGNIIKCRL